MNSSGHPHQFWRSLIPEEIEQKTGLNVSINNKKNNSGSVSFYYQTIDQLDKIIEVIKKNY